MNTIQSSIVSAMMLAGVVACGNATTRTSDTKIVGGDRVSASEAIAKSTVALVTPYGEAFCSGSLIAPRVVLTASHCVAEYDEDTLYVAFGLVAKPGSIKKANVREASNYVHNEDYDPSAMDDAPATRPPNDVAIVTLEEAAPSGYVPVKMLTLDDDIHAGETLTLAGFGLTSAEGDDSGVLRKVDVKMTSVDKASEEIEFGDTPGKSACMGDSGGPAFLERDGQLRLIGVTSRGSSECDSDGIYTDVRYFQNWINQTEKANL